MASPLAMDGLRDMFRVGTYAEGIKTQLGRMEDKFIYWVDKDGGGYLTYSIANEVKEYIQKAMIAQELPLNVGGGGNLSNQWLKMKKTAANKGLIAVENETKLGIASGTLVESLEVRRSGKQVSPGAYAIGIKSGARNKSKWDKLNQSKPVEYGKALEFGWSRGNKTQPARPWMSAGFMMWLRETDGGPVFKNFLVEFYMLQKKLGDLGVEVGHDELDFKSMVESFTSGEMEVLGDHFSTQAPNVEDYKAQMGDDDYAKFAAEEMGAFDDSNVMLDERDYKSDPDGKSDSPLSYTDSATGVGEKEEQDDEKYGTYLGGGVYYKMIDGELRYFDSAKKELSEKEALSKYSGGS